MKLIALDVGTRRIGIAKADSTVRIAIPYAAVEVNNGEEFKKIASLARAWDINNFVLGLPRNSSGEETKQSLYVRQFAQVLKQAIPGAKICFQDESLTSVEAEKRLKTRKKGYQKGDIDSEAAAIILQDFLEEKTGKSTSVASSARRRSVKGVKPNRLSAIIVALVVLFLLVSATVLIYYFYSLRPVSDVDCSATGIEADVCDDQSFLITEGTSVAEVADQLVDAGLIRNAFIFQVYVRLNAHGDSLKAGEYQLNPTMSVEKIVTYLLHGSDSVYSFTVLPGDTLANIRQSLIASGYSATEVDAALAADYSGRSFSWIFEGKPAEASLEGYLYGDTYEFFTDDSAETVIARLIEELASVVQEHQLKDQFAAQGLNLYEGITLASVVQKEANNATDMAKVAQVFLTRLAQGMMLGSDVTAIYAADLVDPDRTTYVTTADVIAIDSPYNTRKYAGLPYGPVSNPSLAALTAVATPDTTMSDMLFFLTGDDGMMYYSITEDEHLQNIQNHCQTLCAISL